MMVLIVIISKNPISTLLFIRISNRKSINCLKIPFRIEFWLIFPKIVKNNIEQRHNKTKNKD